MSKLIPRLWTQIIPIFPEPVLAPRTAKPRGRLRPSPAQVLEAIQAYAVAVWAWRWPPVFSPGRCPKGQAGGHAATAMLPSC